MSNSNKIKIRRFISMHPINQHFAVIYWDAEDSLLAFDSDKAGDVKYWVQRYELRMYE